MCLSKNWNLRCLVISPLRADLFEARLCPVNSDCEEEHSHKLSVTLPERLRCDLILEQRGRFPRELTTRRVEQAVWLSMIGRRDQLA